MNANLSIPNRVVVALVGLRAVKARVRALHELEPSSYEAPAYDILVLCNDGTTRYSDEVTDDLDEAKRWAAQALQVVLQPGLWHVHDTFDYDQGLPQAQP